MSLVRIRPGEPFFSDDAHLLLGDDDLRSSEKDARHLKRVRVDVVQLTSVARLVNATERSHRSYFIVSRSSRFEDEFKAWGEGDRGEHCANCDYRANFCYRVCQRICCD